MLVAPAAHADDDPWWGRDKALHFGISTGLAGGIYGTAALLGASRPGSAAVAASVTFGIGIGKEVADAFGLGRPSWRDLTWDAAGTLLGVGIGLGLDLLLRKDRSVTVSPQLSGISSPRGEPRSYGLLVAFTP